MSDNNQFEFRSKFKKLLNDSNEAIIIAGFEAFMRISAVEARSYLWRMTYSRVEAETVMIQLGIKPCLIQEDKISLLRNELRSEFEKRNPDFLKADVPALACEAYENLLNKADNDTVLANMVFSRCYRTVYESSHIRNRVLALLNSDNDKWYFGGLRQMGFNYYEAEYLKPYHFHIRTLLEQLCAQEKKGEFDPEFFSGVEEEWDENDGGEQLHEEDETEESNDGGIVLKKVQESDDESFKEEVLDDDETEISLVDYETENSDVSETAEDTVYPANEKGGDGEQSEAHVKYKELLPSAILNHKEVFEPFVNKSEDLNTLIAIGNLGYDLNEVVAKKEKIANLVNASNEFAKINKALDLADKVLKEAIREML